METSLKNIYACGDIISFKNIPWFGDEYIRLTNVKHARESSINAVYNIIKGNKLKYELFNKRNPNNNNNNIDIYIYGDFNPKLLAVYINKETSKLCGIFMESPDDEHISKFELACKKHQNMKDGLIFN